MCHSRSTLVNLTSVQPAQRLLVLDVFAKSESNPLYLRLAFEEARLWTSTEPPHDLAIGLRELIRDNLFARLSREDQHGAVLVARALGYLAASRNGLAEDELVDVLSSDIDVYSWFLGRSFHIPPDLQALDPDHTIELLHTSPEQRKALLADPVRQAELHAFLTGVLTRPDGPRLPAVVWSRLLADLQPYLTMRRAEGGDLLAFHHRELTDSAAEVYASEVTGRELHSRLADYFHAKANPNHDHTWTISPEGAVGLRGLAELPYHLTRAGRWVQLYGTLTDFGFLERKTAHVATTTGADARTVHSGVYALLDDFNDALQHENADGTGPKPAVVAAVDLGGGPMIRCPHCTTAHPWQEQANPREFTCPSPGCGARLIVRPVAIEAVYGALKLSAPVLDTDPYLLAGQLVGRLLGRPEPTIRTLLDTAEASNDRPWLCPTTPGALTPPGGPLERAMSLSRFGPVRSVALTPEGRWIITGSEDGAVRVIDRASLQLNRGMRAHHEPVRAVAVSPDGRHIVSGGDDRKVRVFELASSRLEHTLEGHTGPVRAVAVTPDGRHIVSGGDDRTLRVWDLATGRPERTFEDTGWVWAVAVTSDGQRIITGNNDYGHQLHNVRVWNLASGRLERTLEGHTGPICAVAATADGKRIVSGSYDGTVRVWDLTSGQLEQTLEHASWVKAVAITLDGKCVMTGTADGTVRVWDLTSGQTGRTIHRHFSAISGLAVTPQDGKIVVCSDDGSVSVLNLASRHGTHALDDHAVRVRSVAVTPDGHRIISGSDDKTVRVWDLTTGRLERTLEGHTGWVASVACALDGRLAVSGSLDKTVRVWDLTNGQLERTLQGHTNAVCALAVTSDGNRIISGSDDKTVRVWDLTTGRLERTLEGHTGRVTSVACALDGRLAVSGSLDKTVRVWDLTNGQLLHTLKGHTHHVNAVAVAPDGQRIVSGSADCSVRVWNLPSGIEMALWSTDLTPVTCCAVSPKNALTILYGDEGGHLVTLALRQAPH